MSTINAPFLSPRVSIAPIGRARGRRSLLTFELGGQIYGLPLGAVQEIVPMAQLSRPASLPTVLAGFLNLAGSTIPVLYLDRLFALPELTIGLYTPIIVLRHPDCHLALIVQRVARIISVAPDFILPIPDNHTFNDCVEGTATDGDEVVLLLSTERLLLDKEQLCLAELQSREQARLRALEEPTP